MKWTSAISLESDPARAVAELRATVHSALDQAPHLLLAFVSAGHRHHYPALLAALETAFPASNTLLAACTASGVIGPGQELEQGHGISILAGVLPGVALHPMYLDPDAIPSPDAPPDAWRTWMGHPEGNSDDQPDTSKPNNHQLHFLLLVDPFLAKTEALLEGINYAYPDSTVIGGLVSGSAEPGGNLLSLDHHLFHKGAIAIALRGPVAIDTIVAQGCRPIGRTATVTRCAPNSIIRIDGQPAVEWLNRELETLSPDEQKSAKTHLFIGLSVDPFLADPQHGDFLIRNLIGLDFNSGAIILGGHPSEGQLIQFHLRNRDAAHQDLENLLQRHRATAPDLSQSGLLTFSCLGRGTFLYKDPHHDARLMQEHLGPIPNAGFFCNGEIGPVGPATFIHGYTSVSGLIRPPQP